MMSKGWYTAEDILKDVAEATGQRVTIIDDRFAVRGERPPPVHLMDEENDEFMEMYGEFATQNNKVVEPDLPGITSMLRMVNEYYDTATCNDDENIRELKKAANTVITISKLDPNVSEFVPKNVKKSTNKKEIINDTEKSKTFKSSHDLVMKESESNSVKNKILDISDRLTDSSHNNETNNSDIDVTKKIDVASLNAKDIKDIREKLKLKIVGTSSKTECLNKKRERNLAMASLLKLSTDMPNSPKKSEPIKLMTPEYFKTIPQDVTKVKDIDVKAETEEDRLNEEVIKEKHDNDVIKHLPNSTNPVHELSASPENSDLYSNKSTESHSVKQNGTTILSKEMAESVKKVDNWLNGPKKKQHKSRPIYLAPVTFTRKGTASVTSSSPSLPNVDTITERQSSVQTSDSFIPSSYADELTKNYMERSKAKLAQQEDMWTKLERTLKKRDEAIKKGLLSPKSQK